MRKLVTIIIFIIIITIILIIWWNTQLGKVSSDANTKTFVIAKGVGVSEIAKKLKTEKLIRSEVTFKIYVKQNNLSNKLQAGSYKLSPSMSVQDIVKAMQAGSEDIWVTLIEGWRVEEMAQELSSKLQIPNDNFLEAAKEGYMFPDTYLFPRESTVSYIAETLRKTFDNKFSEDLRLKIKDLGLSEEKAVILASLVEREGRSDKVRKEVASILLKRLNIGMKLDVDATVQYALGYQDSEKSWWKRHISREDKKINSPYNTYTNAGLPPGPICNPSLASLQAVANANPNTPYLFYYHDLAGNSHYAETLEQHNLNVVDNP